jgi:hypothetical protein
MHMTTAHLCNMSYYNRWFDPSHILEFYVTFFIYPMPSEPKQKCQEKPQVPYAYKPREKKQKDAPYVNHTNICNCKRAVQSDTITITPKGT